jgi:putative DNA methylase
MTVTAYARRLIEVDLPIKRISAHARREKSIRHGHISTLHIWWARRPLAACRAVICASLWPDPADEQCPPVFRDAAVNALVSFAEQVGRDRELAELCSSESFKRWQRTNAQTLRASDPACWPELRYALLDFIADFANWDASTVSAYLETSRALTQAAHEALGGVPGTRPLVVDPFAGGGAIPLEALRVGADAFASDLNPVAVLLNKVVLEYIPRYGQRLADEVRKWGQWVKEQAEQELAEFYPKDPDGATPIAYLWARTITCEGPGCGAEVPLIRSLWLAKKGDRSVALRLVPNPQQKRIDFEIIEKSKAKDVADGTVRRGSATCPCCGFTTPVASVRRQFKKRRGGSSDARLFCVVTMRPGEQGRFYRLPTERDLGAVRAASTELDRRKAAHTGTLSLVPDEVLDIRGIRHTWAMIYGMERWGDMYSHRQALALTTLVRLVSELPKRICQEIESEQAHSIAIQTCLALGIDRLADRSSALCRWDPSPAASGVIGTFGRQAVPMMWDFVEGLPFEQKSGGWLPSLEWIALVLEEPLHLTATGQIERASATDHPLPDDAADALITDPPYYDAVPYAYLSEFFYVWLRRSLADVHSHLFNDSQVPKDEEIVVDRTHELSMSTKDVAFYERELTRAFAEARRVVQPNGIGTIVFASKTTSSWEAILQAVIDAGWTITGSWPIDTEMENRVAAQGQARLASSVHLVCRPRENADGELLDDVGDWRDVLQELPQRISAWFPRLISEGVVGADAIFACLGPAIEIYSRYSRVEKASGEKVLLKTYLEHVWAIISREALNTILDGTDASNFEGDARLTVIWFWVLKTASKSGEDQDYSDIEDDVTEEVASEDTTNNGAQKKRSGYILEYDAVRKLAQGLGVELAELSRTGGIITIQGSVAVMNTITGRELYLIGEQLSMFGEDLPIFAGRRSRRNQEPSARMQPVQHRMEDLLGVPPDSSTETAQSYLPTLEPQKEPDSLLSHLMHGGFTVLDRLHQAMLLFGRGHAGLLGIFLRENGIGEEPRFWQLAQSLSALYPAATDEKRWVDGVLARKKGLGF